MHLQPSFVIAFTTGLCCTLRAQETFPDLNSVSADIRVPAASHDEPAAGRRTLVRIAENVSSVPYVVWLPENWNRDSKWPVFVELPGNGGYRNALGDECSGRPEDCNMGYGLTEGQDWIWVCLPFLNHDGSRLAEQWWGDTPKYSADSTITYWHAALRDVQSRFSGDPKKVVLAGFSRGAIACNALGLRDDRTSGLWAAFLACSHYDGVRSWPFPESDRDHAISRLQRLGSRPQFICGEASQSQETRAWLEPRVKSGSLIFMSTGFRNHSDQWTLRPCEARTRARVWLNSLK